MSHSHYVPITAPLLLVQLDRAVAEMRSLGFAGNEISNYNCKQVSRHNQFANPHKILLGQLNRYLSEQKPALPSISGDDNKPV